MPGIIYTRTSSRKVRGARKQNTAALEAARIADEELKAKWAAVPKLAGKYETKKKGKAKVKAKPKNVTVLSPAVPDQLRPATGKFDNGVGAQPTAKTYTGDKVLGIAVMHKSCLQPVFSEEAAKDSAKMRR